MTMATATTSPDTDVRIARMRALGFNASPYQEAVFRWVADGDTQAAFVDAVAGSGKSTTIMKAAGFCRPVARLNSAGNKAIQPPSILYLVFSKDMQTEVLNRSDRPNNMECSTTHSFGFAALRGSGKVKRFVVEQYKTGNLLKARLGKTVPFEEFRKVSGMATTIIAWWKNAGMHPDEVSMEDCLEALEDMACDENYPVSWAQGFAGDILAVFRDGLSGHAIDFDDMLYLPTIDDAIQLPAYDWVMVDESQDLNPCQIDLLTKYHNQHPNTRFLFVGDPYQSIFAFRGADPSATPRIIERFGCEKFPLSVTYRCPTNVVKAAQTYVPHLAAKPEAEAGEVTQIEEAEFFDAVQPGDMVLCRCVAPLITHCLAFIKKGRNARVLGRDIGRSLCALYKNHVTPKNDGDNYKALFEARAAALAKLGNPGQENRLQAMNDRFDALEILIPSADADEPTVLAAINAVFDDAKPTYTFSSVHKAKGQERDNVFLVRPELLPFPNATDIQQERNLKYVALTRAKKRFTYVITKPRER
jgi:superfamily I DNA/RNA helicase